MNHNMQYQCHISNWSSSNWSGNNWSGNKSWRTSNWRSRRSPWWFSTYTPTRGKEVADWASRLWAKSIGPTVNGWLHDPLYIIGIRIMAWTFSIFKLGRHKIHMKQIKIRDRNNTYKMNSRIRLKTYQHYVPAHGRRDLSALLDHYWKQCSLHHMSRRNCKGLLHLHNQLHNRHYCIPNLSQRTNEPRLAWLTLYWCSSNLKRTGADHYFHIQIGWVSHRLRMGR